jgi:hypothetical protein
LRIVVHREIPDDPLLRSDWNALVEQMESPQVFYTHEWARAIAEAYADCLPPWLLLTYDENKLTGVASLTVSPDQECASFLAETTADYCDFVSDPSHREALLQAVFLELRSTGVKNLILANLPADSNSARSLSSTSRRHGYRLFLRPAYLCAQVKLGSREERQAINAGSKNASCSAIA